MICYRNTTFYISTREYFCSIDFITQDLEVWIVEHLLIPLFWSRTCSKKKSGRGDEFNLISHGISSIHENMVYGSCIILISISIRICLIGRIPYREIKQLVLIHFFVPLYIISARQMSSYSQYFAP